MVNSVKLQRNCPSIAGIAMKKSKFTEEIPSKLLVSRVLNEAFVGMKLQDSSQYYPMHASHWRDCISLARFLSIQAECSMQAPVFPREWWKKLNSAHVDLPDIPSISILQDCSTEETKIVSPIGSQVNWGKYFEYPAYNINRIWIVVTAL